MIHHKAWVDGVELGLSGLKASLLTRHPETKVHNLFYRFNTEFQKTLFFGKMEHYILKQIKLLQIQFFIFIIYKTQPIYL